MIEVFEALVAGLAVTAVLYLSVTVGLAVVDSASRIWRWVAGKVMGR